MRYKLISGFILFFGMQLAAQLVGQSGGHVDPNTGMVYATGQQIRPALTVQSSQPSSRYPRRQGYVKAALPSTVPAHTNVATKYFQWHDPSEDAFSALLPRGLQISGGTQRTMRLEPHYVIRAQSPSGRVQLVMDEPRPALRQLSNSMMPHKGQIMPSSWDGHLMGLSYHPIPLAAREQAHAPFQ